MIKLSVFGLASGETKTYELFDTDKEKNFMNVLHALGLPIASSCEGAGQCEKCVVNKTLLSCQMRVQDLIRQGSDGDEILISVSYL